MHELDRALALEPEFIVADESVSALDVSIQAQVVNLLMDLRDELDLPILLVSHSSAEVERLADRVITMTAPALSEGTAQGSPDSLPARAGACQ